jgi:hypothetical protein
MRNNEVKLNKLTEMASTTDDPTDMNEIRAKLETARFEEIMYWEKKKRFLLRLILYVLIGILLSLTLQPLAPLLVSRPVERRSSPSFERQPTFDLTPFVAPVRRYSP